MSVESVFAYLLMFTKLFLDGWVILLVGASAVVFRES